MMPPADRIHKDPGQRPRKHPSNVADHDFQAVGPALQLNVEGLSPAKRGIIQSRETPRGRHLLRGDPRERGQVQPL